MVAGLHDFTDRALRELLSQADNLREFVAAAVPELAAGFDFDRMRPAPQEFLLGNWRKRAADLMFEIPYRTADSAAETWALVCVLVEHQTKTDWQIPLKTFVYAAAYWEWQWRQWEEAPAPKPEFALTPVLPLVLHTGPRPWGSAKTLRELLAPPEAFHAFAPDWRPVFWELASHPPDELLSGEAAFLQVLTMLTADDADRAEAERLFAAVFRRIDPLHESRRPRWTDLLRFLLGWARYKRPKTERSDWRSFADNLVEDAARQREIKNMVQTIAQADFEDGRLEGQQKTARAMLIRVARKHLGPPNDAIRAALDSIIDVERVERMLDRHDEAADWNDLLATP